MKKILVVDDERPISDIIKFNLTKEGYEVVTAFDGREALEQFEAKKPDLVILDLMLPELDGLEVAKEIRKTSHTPIIMLSAKDSEFDKVIGLEIGADDYVTKPFSNRELLARIKAHLRRTETIETAVEESSNSGKQEISIGELVIVPDAFVDNIREELSCTRFSWIVEEAIDIRSVYKDLTFSHENDMVSHTTSKAHFVGNNYHVHTTFGKFLHNSKNITDSLWVKS